ncbi:hypothetical protein HOLleu_31454 [Holothuria leucospilota]|uniref:Uncharacterized protein n=1 Tax=Holothuria leucospilota TaxID=206669 RepID=A0A9Q0YQE3_HOLLE|nr:hypothetical protein HOLleu_31454 [Holothuria leucospilota]
MGKAVAPEKRNSRCFSKLGDGIVNGRPRATAQLQENGRCGLCRTPPKNYTVNHQEGYRNEASHRARRETVNNPSVPCYWCALENVIQESVCDLTQCPIKYGTDHGVECKLIGYNASNPMCVNVWSSYEDCNCTNSNYRISASGQTYWCNLGGSWDQSLENLTCLGKP